MQKQQQQTNKQTNKKETGSGWSQTQHSNSLHQDQNQWMFLPQKLEILFWSLYIHMLEEEFIFCQENHRPGDRIPCMQCCAGNCGQEAKEILMLLHFAKNKKYIQCVHEKVRELLEWFCRIWAFAQKHIFIGEKYCCYGYVITGAFRSESEMGWHCIAVYLLNILQRSKRIFVSLRGYVISYCKVLSVPKPLRHSCTTAALLLHKVQERVSKQVLKLKRNLSFSLYLSRDFVRNLSAAMRRLHFSRHTGLKPGCSVMYWSVKSGWMSRWTRSLFKASLHPSSSLQQ